MSQPAHLSHLSIYNPTLLPTPAQLAAAGQETDDAHEHAHIVFYSSSEPAVSRDRMLRQVGLAKALVNFAGMFEPDPAETLVHSQKHRLITISPEPDWWMHASYVLERIPKPPSSASSSKSQSKAKSKSKKDKGKERGKAGGKEEKGRDREKEKDEEGKDEWEYRDELDDEELKAKLMKGYEEFKEQNGTLTSLLLQSRSQLERALETFFTPWASQNSLAVPQPEADPDDAAEKGGDGPPATGEGKGSGLGSGLGMGMGMGEWKSWLKWPVWGG